MSIIFLPKKTDRRVESNLSEEKQESIFPQQHESDITEGGEFLDDAIRMNEQPLGETPVNETNDISPTT